MIHRIEIQKLIPQAVLPVKSHYNDAGFDMVATSKKRTNRYIEYGTGIAMHIPDNMVGLIYPRSSITKKDMMLKNSVGVIDAGYRGEISFRFWITANSKYSHIAGEFIQPAQYEIGDRIGQIIFQELPEVILIEETNLNDSERGTGGYGSTGDCYGSTGEEMDRSS